MRTALSFSLNSSDELALRELAKSPIENYIDSLIDRVDRILERAG